MNEGAHAELSVRYAFMTKAHLLIYLTLSLPKSRRQNFRLHFFKNVKSKLYHIENSKTKGQTV